MKSKLFYEICQFLCTAVGDSFRFSFHHDPDQGLRAGGAYQDAAIPGQCPLSSRDRVLQCTEPMTACFWALSATATFTSTWGYCRQSATSLEAG